MSNKLGILQIYKMGNVYLVKKNAKGVFPNLIIVLNVFRGIICSKSKKPVIKLVLSYIKMMINKINVLDIKQILYIIL